LCDAEELPFLRDIEKLIRKSIPTTDSRTRPSRTEAPKIERHAGQRPDHSSGRRQNSRQGTAARSNGHHGHHGQTGETSDGIGAVAFLRRSARSGR
jgi:hypothetical protein